MWIIFVVLAVVLFFMLRKAKVPKVSSICMVTGGVKSGKSTFSAYMALKLYKKQRFKYRFANVFLKVLHKPMREIPLLYSKVNNQNKRNPFYSVMYVKVF